MMKLTRIIIASTFMLISLMAMSQETPQFSFNNFEGWTYSGGTLTSQLISKGIYLYTTSEQNALTLTSPEFSCQGIDSLAVVVSWKSIDPSVALTTVIDDHQGLPIDSVTSMPTSTLSSQQFAFSIPVAAHGLSAARLRFVSWNADVNNTGAIRKIETQAITSPTTVEPGDVDGSGNTNISDVTALIDHLLGASTTSNFSPEGADVNLDGHINISDVTALIDRLLSNS